MYICIKIQFICHIFQKVKSHTTSKTLSTLILVVIGLSSSSGPEHHSFSDQHGHATSWPLHHRKYPEDSRLQLGSHHVLLWRRPEGKTHHRQLPGVSEETAARCAQTRGNERGIWMSREIEYCTENFHALVHCSVGCSCNELIWMLWLCSDPGLLSLPVQKLHINISSSLTQWFTFYCLMSRVKKQTKKPKYLKGGSHGKVLRMTDIQCALTVATGQCPSKYKSRDLPPLLSLCSNSFSSVLLSIWFFFLISVGSD